MPQSTWSVLFLLHVERGYLASAKHALALVN